MNSRRTVLLDFSLIARGGSETYATGFLDALSRRSDLFDVVVLVADCDVDLEHVVERLVQAGARVHRLRLQHGWTSAAVRQLVVPYLSLRYRANSVFSPREVGAILTPVPLVVLARNLILWSPGGVTTMAARARRLATRTVARVAVARAARVLAVSSVMAQKLPRRRGSTLVIHHGCDLEPVRHARLDGATKPGALRIVALGSISAHKRFDRLIDAVAELHACGQPASLEIWGTLNDTTLAETLREQARDRLHGDPLMGPATRSMRQRILADADVLAMSSSFESFGSPLLEGMRTSCVVWAPESELVDELCGPVAVTYAEGSAEAAARALIAALPSVAELLSAGRDRSMRFNWKSTVDQTLSAVREIASRRSEYDP